MLLQKGHMMAVKVDLSSKVPGDARPCAIVNQKAKAAILSSKSCFAWISCLSRLRNLGARATHLQ